MSRRTSTNDAPLVLDYSARKFSDREIEDRCERVKKQGRKNQNGEYRLNFRDVDFSHNHCTASALNRVVDLCIMCRPSLRVLHLSKNKLDDSSSKHLVSLLSNVGGDLLQLHLSKNEFTEKGAKEIIVAAHKERNNKKKEAPLWLTIDNNKIKTVDEMLDELYDDERVDFCEVESRSCNPKRCKHRDRTVHLPEIHKQSVEASKKKRARSKSVRGKSTDRKKAKKDDDKSKSKSPAKDRKRSKGKSSSPARKNSAQRDSHKSSSSTAEPSKKPSGGLAAGPRPPTPPPDPRAALESLGNLDALKKKIFEQKQELRLFIIKAKKEAEEKLMGETDKEEYYQANPGEVVGEYTVQEAIGKGVFSSVFRSKSKDGSDVAIKLIRSNPMIRKASTKEVEVYKKMKEKGNEVDSEGMKYIMTLFADSYEYKGHLVLPFPLALCDMRAATKKYGAGGGLPLTTVSLYASQLLKALRCLRTLQYIHMDLKPDNLLMSVNKKKVVLCDFGSALECRDIVRTDYAQPRYYRAPEVIVGYPYGCEVDMWSFGCTMFEMATGKILFKDGRNNNHILKQFMEAGGGVPITITTEGQFADKHFDPLGDFKMQSTTGKESPVLISCKNMKGNSEMDWGDLLQETKQGDTKVKHSELVDRLSNLLRKIIRTDPRERILPVDALEHNFFDLK